MDRSTLSLRRLAFGLMGLVALNGFQVGAAVVQPKEQRCDRGYGRGRGYGPRCPEGYDCVKAAYGYHSTCSKTYGGYQPSTTPPYEPSPTPSYPPTLPTYPPTYTTSSTGYPSSSYPTADTTSSQYQPSGYPPSEYQPTGQPSDYQPTSYQPTGYQPTSYQPSGYQPSDYQSSGYQPSEYQPSSYQPTGYQPSSYQPSESQPSGYEPTGYQPSDYQPSGYTPTSSTPTGYTQNCQPTGYPNSYGPSGYNATTCGNGYSGGGGSNGGGSGNGSGNGTGGDTEPGFTPVVGVKRVVERRSIDVLQTEHPDVFNMYVLALESLQKRNESISVSWYQVSGIHGYPYIPWQEPEVSPPFRQLGYCTHNSVLFTTWHRPYLVLLEQLLYEEAVKIAKGFTGDDAAKYQAAAEDVRLPYWDWALNEASSRIPAALQQTSITVVKPGSGSTEIPNPLYHYRFLGPQPEDLFEATTIRSPDANDLLAASFQSRRQSTFNFFAHEEYNAFSNDIENVHGGVHVEIGGDMAIVPSSAFDPVFWLHHTQVDRIMAMYQATRPGLYLRPGERSETFSLQGPGQDDLSTALGPFRHEDRTYWNSDEVKTAESIFKYGYAYPEVPQGKSTEELRVFTTEKVNQLYGPDTSDRSFAGDESGVPETPTARREWSANVLVDSEELPGSHRILIYVGPYDENNPGTNNLVGVAAIFTGPDRMPEANRQLNITVPLTSALVEKNVALRPEDAVPALTGELHWAVEKVGQSVTPVPVDSLKTLKVSVVSHIVEHPQNDAALPVKSEPLTHYAPTVGKVGGLQPGEAPPVGNAAPPSLDRSLTDSTSGTNSTSAARI